MDRTALYYQCSGRRSQWPAVRESPQTQGGQAQHSATPALDCRYSWPRTSGHQTGRLRRYCRSCRLCYQSSRGRKASPAPAQLYASSAFYFAPELTGVTQGNFHRWYCVIRFSSIFTSLWPACRARRSITLLSPYPHNITLARCCQVADSIIYAFAISCYVIMLSHNLYST